MVPSQGSADAIIAIASERDRARAFSAARRHTRLVRALRIVMPVVAIGTVALFVGRLAVTSYLQASGIEMSGTRIDTKNLTMETPRYEGFGKDGSRYIVRAREAITDLKRSGPIRLNDIDGRLTQTTGVVTDLKANWGTYDERQNILELYEQIDVDGSTGMKARLTRATIHTKESRIVSDEPIWALNENGTITARSMVLRQREHKAAFKGQVHVTMRQNRPAATQPDGLRAGVDLAESAAAGATSGHSKAGRAQSPMPGLSANSGKPIEVRSATLDVDDNAKTAQFRHEVIARQGDATLEAPELDVAYEGRTALSDGAAHQPAAADDATKVRRIEARGGVTSRNKDDTAISQTLTYDARTDTALLVGDVVLTSTGDRRATAEQATFDQRTERAVLVGTVVLTQGADRRVTGDRAEFDQKADTGLVVGKEVVAMQGRNILKGRRLQLDRKAGTTRLDSPALDGQPVGRIATTFYQNEKADGGKGGAKAVSKGAENAAPGPFAMSFKTNPDAPIEVEADTLDVFDPKRQAVFRGKVVAKQGDFIVHTVEMTAFYTGQAGLGTVASPLGPAAEKPARSKGDSAGEGTQLTRIEARQKVIVTSKDGREAIGDWADFDVKANTIVVGGTKVTVSDGKSLATGTRLLIDMTTGRSTFHQPETAAPVTGQSQPAVSAAEPATGPGASSNGGAGCPPGAVCTRQRASVVLYPKEVESKGKEVLKEIDKDGWATTAEKEAREGRQKRRKKAEEKAADAPAGAVSKSQ
jgi:hypothetical protein